jgi:hypothetical protein
VRRRGVPRQRMGREMCSPGDHPGCRSTPCPQAQGMAHAGLLPPCSHGHARKSRTGIRRLTDTCALPAPAATPLHGCAGCPVGPPLRRDTDVRQGRSAAAALPLRCMLSVDYRRAVLFGCRNGQPRVYTLEVGCALESATVGGGGSSKNQRVMKNRLPTRPTTTVKK